MWRHVRCVFVPSKKNILCYSCQGFSNFLNAAHVGASVFVRLSHSCFYFKAFQASTGKRGAGGRTHPGPRRNEDNIWQHPRHLRGSHQNKGSVSSSKPSSTNIIMMVSFSERSLLTCYLCMRVCVIRVTLRSS